MSDTSITVLYHAMSLTVLYVLLSTRNSFLNAMQYSFEIHSLKPISDSVYKLHILTSNR